MMFKPRAMRDAFLAEILMKMEIDERIFFVSADFGSPVLDEIRGRFPNRFLNVGVAEQNLINVSAGLALEGFKVFAYAIAPFITMRCFEQLRVNLALLSEVRELNVNLIGVGAGYSYVVSGPTHQCYEDIALIRNLPNFQIFSPSDQVTAASLIDLCIDNTGPKYLRFDAQVLQPLRDSQAASVEADGFDVLRDGVDGIIVATGFMTHTALNVARELEKLNLKIAVVDLINLTGFDRERLASILSRKPFIFSFEEGFEGRGGLDSIIMHLCHEHAIEASFHGMGVKPGYQFELGSRDELHEQVGVGFSVLMEKLKAVMER